MSKNDTIKSLRVTDRANTPLEVSQFAGPFPQAGCITRTIPCSGTFPRWFHGQTTLYYKTSIFVKYII